MSNSETFRRDRLSIKVLSTSKCKKLLSTDYRNINELRTAVELFFEKDTSNMLRVNQSYIRYSNKTLTYSVIAYVRDRESVGLSRVVINNATLAEALHFLRTNNLLRFRR